MKDKHKLDKQRLLDFLDLYKLKNTTSFVKVGRQYSYCGRYNRAV